MSDKSVIVIGAGIAGLSAGCYAQMNGYRTSLYELHTQPGGLCTAWQRKGYTIDGCIHWLVGSSPENSFYRLWQEIGLIQGREIIDLDEFARIVVSTGQTFTFYCNLDRFEAEMLEISPEDRPVIEELIGDARQFMGLDLGVDAPPPELMTPAQQQEMMGKMMPYLPLLGKWSAVTVCDFAARFKSPVLREAFERLWDGQMSFVFFIMTFGWLHSRSAGYPIGGSLPMMKAVEQRFLKLGGEVHYKARVAKILVENNRAVGVRLENGEEHRADVVISAADGHATIFDMLEGKFIDDTIRHYYDTYIPFPGLVYIGIGVNRTFEQEPGIISGYTLQLPRPLVLGDRTVKRLGFHIYNFDPTFAPPGKTVLTAMFGTSYAYWKALHQDRGCYEAKKQEIVDAVIQLLDERYPGLAQQVEMIDVSTPITFEKYTGNWQGSYEGWLPTPANAGQRMCKTLPGLENFYMAGQWVAPGGGLPGGVTTGREVVQMICHKDGVPFTTTTE